MVAGLLENSPKNAYIEGMDLFSMFFAIVMLAAAIAATVFIGIYAGGFWTALGFAALVVGIYKLFTYQSGPDVPLRGRELNAWQQSLSDD
jgi:hypothetical protein